MATNTSAYRPIVAGSGITTIRFNPNFDNDNKTSELVAFARMISNTPPQPVAEAVAVQPLNYRRPVEVVTPLAQGHGVITLNLIQVYNQEAWNRLPGLTDAQDFADVSNKIVRNTTSASPPGCRITKWTRPPMANKKLMVEDFYGCVVVRIGDDDPIQQETTVVNKDITFWYVYSLKNYVNSGNLLFDSVTEKS